MNTTVAAGHDGCSRIHSPGVGDGAGSILAAETLEWK
jgi:hypothetical protein